MVLFPKEYFSRIKEVGKKNDFMSGLRLFQDKIAKNINFSNNTINKFIYKQV